MSTAGAFILAVVIGGIVFAIARDEWAYRTCLKRGHRWQSRHHPIRGLFLPWCSRCRNWQGVDRG